MTQLKWYNNFQPINSTDKNKEILPNLPSQGYQHANSQWWYWLEYGF